MFSLHGALLRQSSCQRTQHNGQARGRPLDSSLDARLSVSLFPPLPSRAGKKKEREPDNEINWTPEAYNGNADCRKIIQQLLLQCFHNV